MHKKEVKRYQEKKKEEIYQERQARWRGRGLCERFPHPIQSQCGPWLAERPRAKQLHLSGPWCFPPHSSPRSCPRKQRALSCSSPVQFFATLRTPAHQAPLPMGFSRQEYWSELPCPPPGALPNPEIECASPVSQADSSPAESPGKPLRKHSPVSNQ